MVNLLFNNGGIGAPSMPSSDEENGGVVTPVGQTLMDDAPVIKEPCVKLIITFFEIARHTPDILKDHLPPTTPAFEEFRRLLADLAPTSRFTRCSTYFPAPYVTQSIYIIQEPYKQEDWSALRQTSAFKNFENLYKIEVIIDQHPNTTPTPAPNRPLSLALFDMDSTLIDQEVIDELARSVGVSDAVSAITARAMNGDIDFATSLKERVGMLKGVKTTVWEDLRKTITIAEGARELIAGLKRRGVYTAVASGGFTPMAEWLKGELGLDIAVANTLLVEEPTEEFPYPHLSGLLDPAFPIVTPEFKRATLLSLAAAHTVPMHETLAVGDGSNDLLMLDAAGLGIAWRAKVKVQIAAPMRLNGETLADLLYLFGPESDR